jgi:ubiquinone/menaquinone biosynthesis C-methylase UbiE
MFDTRAHGGTYSRIEAWLYDRIAAPSVERWNDILLREPLAALPKGGRVLDVGCGGGQLVERLGRQRSDLRLDGIDPTPVQIRRARRRCQALGDRVRLELGRAEELPYPDGLFDAVICVLVLKHLSEPEVALEHCRRVLKPGALLLVVEAERGATLESARNFVGGMRLPFWMRPFALPFFYTWVTGIGPSLPEAEALWANQQLERSEVNRLSELPGLVLTGFKPAR